MEESTDRFQLLDRLPPRLLDCSQAQTPETARRAQGMVPANLQPRLQVELLVRARVMAATKWPGQAQTRARVGLQAVAQAPSPAVQEPPCLEKWAEMPGLHLGR